MRSTTGPIRSLPRILASERREWLQQCERGWRSWRLDGARPGTRSASASSSRTDTRRSGELGSRGAATTARSGRWLAARLCAEAGDGHILVDGKVRAAIQISTSLEPAGDPVLKGLHRAVPTSTSSPILSTGSYFRVGDTLQAKNPRFRTCNGMSASARTPVLREAARVGALSALCGLLGG